MEEVEVERLVEDEVLLVLVETEVLLDVLLVEIEVDVLELVDEVEVVVAATAGENLKLTYPVDI